MVAFDIGLSEADFWDCTPYQFSAYVHTVNQRRESAIRQSWEQVRWQTAALLSPYSKKALAPKDLIVFPWEETASFELILPENFAVLSTAMDKQRAKELSNK